MDRKFPVIVPRSKKYCVSAIGEFHRPLEAAADAENLREPSESVLTRPGATCATYDTSP
jgi:hypothetical protein